MRAMTMEITGRTIPLLQGNVQSIIAANTTPRILYCATDQGFYHWREGSTQIIADDTSPYGDST